MIDSTALHAVALSRTPDAGLRNLRETTRRADELVIASRKVMLPLEEVYRGVGFTLAER